METLVETLRLSHDWAVDRIHLLCDQNEEHEYQNAYSIQLEFNEWLNPNIEEHDILSMSYLKDKYI